MVLTPVTYPLAQRNPSFPLARYIDSNKHEQNEEEKSAFPGNDCFSDINVAGEDASGEFA